MIRLELNNLYSGGHLRRPQYRARCKDGATRIGYLCFMVKKHWFRPATERVYLRESITGRLYRFHPETLACWTGVADTKGKPICNGDTVMREDSYTGATETGEIYYCANIAGFVWKSTDSKYKRVEPLYDAVTVSNDGHEYKVFYKYTILGRKI